MPARKILVCGGAGYIGSHMVRMLSDHGYQVTVIDNLSSGRREAIEDWCTFFQTDIRDKFALKKIFHRENFDTVFHFSGLIAVGESVEKPALYYDNNVVGTLTLLEVMREADVNRFVFSSSAAVYGNPETERITEKHPLRPLNPYGRSKLMVEQILTDFSAAYGLRSVSFRYFNAAGAHPDGVLGESHDPETHLIPNVLFAALNPKQKLKVYGNNYPTSDGTCIRDYIHVLDLCKAHMAAIQYLNDHPGANVFNLGNGRGFSVLEVISTASQITGVDIPHDMAPAREGDAAILVADSRRARHELGWSPDYEDLKDIITTAWQWHKNNRII